MFDRCLYFNTNHLSRVVNKIWKDAYDELDLAPAHAYLLRLILKKPGLVQKEVSLELHLEKSTITRSIDKMVADGYLIRKASSENNQKEQCIFALPKAKKIEKRLNEIGDELYANLQTKISKDDLTTLVALERLTSKKL
jgi:DNA-binding MarR family transcriptional regulator